MKTREVRRYAGGQPFYWEGVILFVLRSVKCLTVAFAFRQKCWYNEWPVQLYEGSVTYYFARYKGRSQPHCETVSLQGSAVAA
jgi:hypothetical protein